MLSKIIRYLKTDIWRIQIEGFSRKKSVLIRHLRIIILALRGFDEDKCFLRASSLTFYSLFSIVPVLAIIFGIAKGFRLEGLMEAQIVEKFPGQQEIMTRFIHFSQSLLQQTTGGIIAGIGLIVLLWSVVRILNNTENSFNEIWGILKSRSPGRKFSDYLAIIFIGPVLLVLSGSVNVLVTTHLELIVDKVAVIEPLIIFLVKLLPHITVWIFLSFIYSFIPNTRVGLKSAVLGGVVSGTIYRLVQWIYITFQIGASRYGAIYGSFTAVPLFLMWIQISWLIVLFGAELSFAHQNVETYEFEHDCLRISPSLKRLISLKIAHLLVKNFSGGKESLNGFQVARKLAVPIRLVNEILYELMESGIISEVNDKDKKNVYYQPARDPEILTLKYVMDALDDRGSHNIPIVKSEELNRIGECLKTFSEITEKSPANIPLEKI